MKVLVVPADTGACGTYRMVYPAAACMLAGHDVEIGGAGWLSSVVTHRSSSGALRIHAAADLDADVVVLQRPATDQSLASIEWLKARGHRVVAELDDDLLALTDRNVAYAGYQRPGHNLALFRACMQAVDDVVVSTPKLANKYGGTVMENRIPADYITIGERSIDQLQASPPILGWTGSMTVHRRDLSVVGPGLRDALKAAADWRFIVIGVGGHELQAELHLLMDVFETGWMPIEEYAFTVSALDVGIAPVDLTTFNESKSWLKSLEYAALGVPHVCADTPEYRRLGAGLFADSPARWRARLLELMTDPERRLEMAKRGLDIARQWTYEGAVDEWWSAWTGVRASRQDNIVVRSSA